MTIRQRLTFAFAVIITLFAANLAIQFWGGRQRSVSFQQLQRAVQRQILLASIKQGLHDLHSQVSLLSDLADEVMAMAPDEEDQSHFQQQTEAVAQQIHGMHKLCYPSDMPQVDELLKLYRQLSASWLKVFRNFGTQHAQVAAREFKIHAEPLVHRVEHGLVAKLQEVERQRSEAATANLREVERVTDRWTIIIFGISALVAGTVALMLTRQLSHGLDRLEAGAAALGGGDLRHRIALPTKDELGKLAHSFNDMSDRLLAARTQLEDAHTELEERHREVERQKQMAEALLFNMLPEETAQELKEKWAAFGLLNADHLLERAALLVDPRYYEDITILFTDFVGFTLSTEHLAAEELVHQLNSYITAFDQVIDRYDLWKVKTIGDSYMCAAGLPMRTPSHPVDMVLAAFEMLKVVEDLARKGPVTWGVRIGIHTGPVVSGLIGYRRFAQDIWGDSVNYASRMESSGARNRINISERTYSRIKDFFECEARGKVATKDKREVDMYFVNGILPKLIDDSAQSPPPAFLRRYRVYFQKDPPAFPSFLTATDHNLIHAT